MTSLKQHYKERDPMDTVQLITDFFTNRGYKIKITSIEQSEIGTWTCHVEIFKGNLKIQHAHGKGVTKEYCLASGHAELYERFCNKAVNGVNKPNTIIINAANFKTFTEATFVVPTTATLSP